MRALGLLWLGLLGLLVSACHPPLIIAGRPAGTLAPGATVLQDVSPKEELRLVQQEVFLRGYLQLFGGLPPLQVQKLARGPDGGQLFDSWGEYLSSLGFPDYRNDLPRAPQTNALMIATFERMGVALCDRAVEHDMKATPPPPIPQRLLFAFDLPRGPLSAQAFNERLDVLHQAFLSYPLDLAPPGRPSAFFQLYKDTVARHRKPGSPRSRFSPEEAGWAAVCYGLSRHPEHHLY